MEIDPEKPTLTSPRGRNRTTKMNESEKRTAEIKLRAVAAEAESLADDLRNGKLWEGDCSRRIGAIHSNLLAAGEAAAKDRQF